MSDRVHAMSCAVFEDMSCDCGGMKLPGQGKPQPLRKVTELVGHYVDGGYEGSYLIRERDDEPGAFDVDDLVPDACRPREGYYGPKGRYRIAVEFWPDEAAK